MRRNLATGTLMFLLFFLWQVSAGAKEVPEAWHTRDLFFYDEGGLIKRLYPLPKLLIEFDPSMGAAEREEILAELPMVSRSKDPQTVSRVVAEFRQNTAPAEIVQFANRLLQKKGVMVSLVFLVENIEAVVESIEVEPKITISTAALRERIARFGKVDIQRIDLERNVMRVIFNEIKPPLNILKLANLLHNDSWLKIARPRFRFLHDPIVARLSIEPVSGTVGEERKAHLSVRIFDPLIKLDETRLPNFGEGIFMPMIGYDPSRAMRPKEYFFEVLGSRVKEERRDKRSKTVIYTWRFKHHELGENGEWTIHPQTIPYEKDGVPGEVNTNSVTMVVTSLIGSLNINDMPSPASLPYPVRNPKTAIEVPLPSIPSYWYDRWIKNPTLLYTYGYRTAVGFGTFTILLFVFLLYVPLKDRMRAFRRYKEFFAATEGALSVAIEQVSYAKLSDVLSQVLHAAFPEKLPPHPTLEIIEETPEVRSALEPVWDLIQMLFGELEKRHSPKFMASAEDARRLAEAVRQVLYCLKHRIA